MQARGVAILAGAMFVSSTFGTTDAPAAWPIATANFGGVQQSRPQSDVVLLTISDSVLGDGIAVIAPKN